MKKSANLEVIINGKNKGLINSIKQSESAIDKMSSSVKKLGVMIGTAFAFDSIVSGVNNVVNSIDNLNHTADKLGIATQALEQLRYAADLSGINNDEFDNSLQRMVRRIAEAKQGAGEAKGALIELGLSAQTLGNMTPDQQLLTLADALKGVKEHSDKVRIAFKLFDTEGVKMLNMLDGGRSTIQGYMNDLSNMGLVTDDQIQKNDDFKGALTKVEYFMKSVENRIVGGLMPQLTNLLDGWADNVLGSESFAKSVAIVTAVLKGAIGMVGAFTKSLQLSANGWKLAGAKLDKFLFKMGQGQLKSHKVRNARIGGELDANYQKALKAVSATAESMKLDVGNYIAEVEEMFSKIGTVEIKDIEVPSEPTPAAKTNALKLGEKIGKATSSGIKRNINTGVTEKVDEMAQSFEGSFNGFFDSLMSGTQSWGDSFKQMIKEITMQLLRMQLTNSVSSKGGGLLSGLFGNLFKSNVDFLGLFANGGVVGSPTALATPSGLAIAGEAGAEAIMPLTKVNGKLGVKAVGGSSNVQVNVINNNNSAVDVQKRDDGIIDIVISAITEDIVRGTGSVGGALEHRYGLSKI